MEILSINFLTPVSLEVVDRTDQSRRTILAFFDNQSGRVFFQDKLEEANAEQVREALAEYCSSTVEQAVFTIPTQIMENISRARSGDNEYFGLTGDLQSWDRNKKEGTQDG